MNINQLIDNYQEFILQLEGAVTETKESNFDPQVCEDALDRFYTEGWEYNYSDDGNFYKKGNRNEEIEEKLVTNEDKARYLELQKKLWKILPDFYLAHKGSFEYIEPPQDYDINKPFEC